MIGLLFELLFEHIETQLGKPALQEIKQACDISDDQKYRIDTYYPDSLWRRVFQKTCQTFNKTTEAFETEFAQYTAQYIREYFAGFFVGVSSSLEMIHRQPSIHNSMSSSLLDPALRQAMNDKFRLKILPDKTLMYYTSPNQHCGYYKAFVQALADYYQENIVLWEEKCQKLGDDCCEIHIRSNSIPEAGQAS